MLGIALCGTTTAFLVTLAKLQEEKERRWDEISLRQTIENEKDAEIAKLTSCISDEINDYNRAVYEKGQSEQKCEGLELCIKYLIERNDYLQDRLSAILCPTNNHVWKDGCCVKCGRVKDAAD